MDNYPQPPSEVRSDALTHLYFWKLVHEVGYQDKSNAQLTPSLLWGRVFSGIILEQKKVLKTPLYKQGSRNQPRLHIRAPRPPGNEQQSSLHTTDYSSLLPTNTGGAVQAAAPWQMHTRHLSPWWAWGAIQGCHQHSKACLAVQTFSLLRYLI